jgi:hypothetical protein
MTRQMKLPAVPLDGIPATDLRRTSPLRSNKLRVSKRNTTILPSFLTEELFESLQRATGNRQVQRFSFSNSDKWKEIGI